MRRTVAIALIVAGISIVAIPVLAASRNNETTTKRVSGTIKRVVVETESGSITVRPGSPQVKRVERWNHTRPSYSQKLEDGTLTVKADCPSSFITLPFNTCAVDLALLVPRNVTVKAASTNGPVAIKDLTGSTVQASTTNGSVTLSALRSRSVRAHTSNGNVNLTSLVEATAVDLSSTNGDIAVTIPKGTYDIRTNTTNGDVSVKGLENDADASSELSASTTNGNITLSGS